MENWQQWRDEKAKELKNIPDHVERKTKFSEVQNSKEYKDAEREKQVVEFKGFMLPEVYPGLDGNAERFAVLYDGKALLDEIRKQRDGDRRSTIADSIRATRFTGGRLLDNPWLVERLKEGQKEIVEKVCPDYLLTEDGVALNILTDDNEKLSTDLEEYFRSRAVVLHNDDFQENHIPNLTEELKDIIFSHLNLPYVPYGRTDDGLPSEIRSKTNCIDIEFKVYPGIVSQVRFGNSIEGIHNTFDGQRKLKFNKRLAFNNPQIVHGYVSGISPDLAMQLDLLVFLKKRGHVPNLQMSKNAAPYYDYPEKEHNSFAV
ncbi:MAG: hypothetical protein V4664_02405 [Patescibacteria group bacterium]